MIAEAGQTLLGWRDVPVDNSGLPGIVLSSEPRHRQAFIGRSTDIADDEAFERRLYLIRKVISNRHLRDHQRQGEHRLLPGVDVVPDGRL